MLWSVCRHRNQFCLRSSRRFSTAAMFLYRPPVVTCGEFASAHALIGQRSDWSTHLLLLLCLLASGGRFVSNGPTAPTLMFAFLLSPWRATRTTRRRPLATRSNCSLAPPTCAALHSQSSSRFCPSSVTSPPQPLGVKTLARVKHVSRRETIARFFFFL